MNRFNVLASCVCCVVLVIAGCAPKLTRQQEDALSDILVILNTAITGTEEILNKNTDPTNPYQDILDKLHFMQSRIEEMRTGKAPFDAERIARYTGEIMEIEANVRNAVDKVFNIDVFFELGKYRISDLSEEGKAALQAFARTLIEKQLKKLRKLFPERPLTVVIKSIGYADETPPGPELAERLEEEIAGPLPKDPAERRKAYNKKLSFLRAETIFEYVKIRTESMMDLENVTFGKPEIIGLGEEYPYPREMMVPPYAAEDERRRICKLYSKVNISAASQRSDIQ